MKKGFTLVELLVSIVLLSIGMLFMTNFVLSFKEQKKESNIDVNLMTNQAAISKTINYDAATYGIDDVECESAIKCNITFDDESSKTIELTNNKNSIKYYDSSNVYLVRTLSNDTFEEITYSSEELEYGTFYKIVISLTNNQDYNIEIYDY